MDVRRLRHFALRLALSLRVVEAGALGAAAPAFALPDRDAKTTALASLRGQAVYVDLWAWWCGCCRKSFRWMNAMQQKSGAQGFKVVAVNVAKRRDELEARVRALLLHS